MIVDLNKQEDKMKQDKEVVVKEVKAKILETFEKYPIKNVEQAIKFLEDEDGLETEEVNIKWVVTSPLSYGEDWKRAEGCFEFANDESLIEWAKEERYKIEEAENETR